MIKMYYAGRDPNDHSNFTRFPVASVSYTEETFELGSKIFLNQHPELFEIGVEINGRKLSLASGIVPIQI